MRIVLELDDELVERARHLTGLTEMAALVQEALKALIARESSRRLSLLGGTELNAKAPPR